MAAKTPEERLEIGRRHTAVKRLRPDFLTKQYARKRRWVANNLERNRTWHKFNQRKLRLNPAYRVVSNVRSAIGKFFKGKKSQTSERMLGCSFQDFRNHILNQLCGEMTPDNYGSFWHLDHIIPISAWDLSNPDHVAAANHYTNFAPLEALLNKSKGGTNTKPPGFYDSAIREQIERVRNLDMVAHLRAPLLEQL